jgi:hypothetical protein
MTARPRPIVVIIDEMVLHGFQQRHAPGIATALRTELATSLAGWHPGAGTSIDHIDAGSFIHPGADTPEAVGQAVARHVRHALPGRPMPGPRRGPC